MTEAANPAAAETPVVQAQLRHIDTLTPYVRNSRTHSDEQVAQIAASIEEFGFTNPILADEKGIVAGHGRVMAVKRLISAGRTIQLPSGVALPAGLLPVVDVSGWSDAKRRAYVIADNKLALNADWDNEALKLEIADLKTMDFNLDVLGFEPTELDALFAPPEEESEGLTDPDETPETPSAPITLRGDVWICGKHRIMCGDSTSGEDVEKLLAGATAQLLHADPPYGMGKAAEGVAGDNVYGDELDAFQMQWWNAFRPYLSANASAYIWGNAPELWSLWYAGGLGKSEPLELRGEIVWDKKNIAGMASPDLNTFPIASERALFFQLGRYVFQVGQCKDDYWPGWEPLRTALVAERDKAGWTNKRVGEIVGTHMAGHWFGQSQWVMIDKKSWDKLAAAAEGKAFAEPFEEMHARYKQLQAIFNGDVRDPRREGFDAGRPYFDNTHDVMRDVWDFSRVVGEERHGHATPKPVAMMERVMRSSLRAGELVLEPFGGSGSTLIGAEKSGRVCYSMELQPCYVDVAVLRWQRFTGKHATLESNDRTFNEMLAQRGEPGQIRASVSA